MSESYDDKFAEVMSRRVGDTAFCNLEVYLIGQTVLNWINMTAMLGHTRPGNSLDYVGPKGNVWSDMVRDFIAWTSGRDAKSPGCEDRLRAHIVESGWSRYVADGVGSHMAGDDLADTG